ncbi:MAG: hypothetical protein HKP58_11625 [Desulfatitalea sp.]|nr:hypothetical protein [Desulfatitalea sp.]NNK01052.1 hypothetical protein [Desulfatitalea sp.]
MMQYDTSTGTINDLKFFGEIAASVSHEIKNSLAVINEAAGLLQDMVQQEKKGQSLGPEKVGRVADQIVNRVFRTDTVVKNLNRFAHSVDTPVQSIDVTELLALVLALGQRLANSRGVTLTPEPTAEKLILHTHSFHLMQLLWRCTEFTMSAADVNKVIRISGTRKNDCIIIRYSGIDKVRERMQAEDFLPSIAVLLKIIGGELDVTSERHALRLKLPVRIPAGI